ncbi:MAG: ABC transporter permease subunit [Oscillospiraceae bacterium]|nr:ABC transporter permease subunit [Oscillospiraceae bacterium]
MIRYILKRILLLIPVIIAVSFLVFTLMDLAPGDPIETMLAGGAELSLEDIQALREQFHLDRSVFFRYGIYMLNLLQGDLGVSDVTGIDVWNLFTTRLPYTLVLALGGLIIGAGISIPMGIRAAKRAGKLTDNVTTTFTLIGMSMPGFWLGILLILLFSQHLGWFPAGGARHGFRSFVLPAVCSGMMLMALSTRQTRSSMLEVLKSDYLRTARAKGVPEKSVIRQHALGNAWIPIVTTIGTSLSASLAGSAVVESVFAWPGIGRMTVEAVNARDVTTVTGAVIMTTIIYVLIQLAVDVLYAFVDPRIKAQYIGTKKKKAGPPTKPALNVSNPSVAAALAGSGNKGAATATVSPAAVSHAAGSASGSIYENEADEAAPKAKPSAADVITKSFATRTIDLKKAEMDLDDADVPATVSGEFMPGRYHKRSRAAEIFRSLRRNKGAMAGLSIVGVLLGLLIFSLFISFDAIIEPNVAARFTPPGSQFWFGSDGLGRDQFLRVVFGTRYSLGIGFGATILQAVIGIFLGTLAGYYGKIIDEIIMRFSDILASIPGILLGMVIVTVLGQSFPNLIVAVAVTGIPIYIRITRASILSIRGQEYVEAAKAIGLSDFRIMFTQVLSNGLAPIIVTFTTSLGITIIVAASLSFLGFGVPVPHPEWGALISGGREFIRNAPWLTTFPGIFIMVTVLAFNLLGDGLRDALDPKQKK